MCVTFVEIVEMSSNGGDFISGNHNENRDVAETVIAFIDGSMSE